MTVAMIQVVEKKCMGAAVVARGDATPILDLAEHALDFMTLLDAAYRAICCSDAVSFGSCVVGCMSRDNRVRHYY
jgi:hypothetical protein